MYAIMLTNEAGETVASVGWESLEADVVILGGFLSAIQMMAKNISGDAIEELVFGEMKMLISTTMEYNIVTLHSSSEEDAVEKNQQVTDLVRQNADLDFNDGFSSSVAGLADQADRTEKGFRTPQYFAGRARTPVQSSQHDPAVLASAAHDAAFQRRKALRHGGVAVHPPGSRPRHPAG